MASKLFVLLCLIINSAMIIKDYILSFVEIYETKLRMRGLQGTLIYLIITIGMCCEQSYFYQTQKITSTFQIYQLPLVPYNVESLSANWQTQMICQFACHMPDTRVMPRCENIWKTQCEKSVRQKSQSWRWWMPLEAGILNK